MSVLKKRLEATIDRADEIRKVLGTLQQARGHEVHFRPSATGVAMVGLTSDRPQRGKSGIRDLARLARNFEEAFKKHCLPDEQGRETPEKALQSFLIRNALSNGRRMKALEAAVGKGAALRFITDELSLPDGKGKVVCDLLALRNDHTPVVIELKSARELGRLVYQVRRYADVVDDHRDEFARLFSAVLGRPIQLQHPAEKWIVWPPPAKGDRGPGDDQVPKDIEVFVYRPTGRNSFGIKLVR